MLGKADSASNERWMVKEFNAMLAGLEASLLAYDAGSCFWCSYSLSLESSSTGAPAMGLINCNHHHHHRPCRRTWTLQHLLLTLDHNQHDKGARCPLQEERVGDSSSTIAEKRVSVRLLHHFHRVHRA